MVVYITCTFFGALLFSLYLRMHQDTTGIFNQQNNVTQLLADGLEGCDGARWAGVCGSCCTWQPVACSLPAALAKYNHRLIRSA